MSTKEVEPPEVIPDKQKQHEPGEDLGDLNYTKKLLQRIFSGSEKWVWKYSDGSLCGCTEHPWPTQKDCIIAHNELIFIASLFNINPGQPYRMG